jgi:hypothetical protein
MNEQVHDRVTAAVAPRPSSTPARIGILQRKRCACGGTPGPSGECAECRTKRLQRRATDRATPTIVPPIVHEALRSPGQPLDSTARASMESHFGHDFGKVRVHADEKAAESARAVSASAYTVGRNVVFGERQYEPGAAAGRRLLAHELTHVVQQGPDAQAPQAIGAPSSPAEREADQAARVTQGGRGEVSAGVGSGTLQRQEADEDEFRLRLPEPGRGLGFGQPRIGFDLPELQLDPEIAAQIRAIQLARGLISVESIMAAADRLAAGGPSPGAPGVPGLPPGLVPPSPTPPPGGGPATSGAPGQPPVPARPPLVPSGKGPEKARAATAGDLVKAVVKIPAVKAKVDGLREQAIGELWKKRSGGERAAILTTGITLGAGVVAGIATHPEAGPSRFLLGQVQGKDIPIPGLPMTFNFNLTGPDQRLLIGLDVGALLPPEFGFKQPKKEKR